MCQSDRLENRRFGPWCVASDCSLFFHRSIRSGSVVEVLREQGVEVEIFVRAQGDVKDLVDYLSTYYVGT
jgi:hypothetical protein